MTPDTFKNIRNPLGLSQRGTARLFRMGQNGWRNLQRWESGDQDLPWWASFIITAYNDGGIPDWRDHQENMPAYMVLVFTIIFNNQWPDLAPFMRKRKRM